MYMPGLAQPAHGLYVPSKPVPYRREQFIYVLCSMSLLCTSMAQTLARWLKHFNHQQTVHPNLQQQAALLQNSHGSAAPPVSAPFVWYCEVCLFDAGGQE